MPVAWFICPYKRDTLQSLPARYCAMHDFTPQIRAVNGDWSETEILGDRAIVKVRGPNAALDAIAATPTFRRIPTNKLNDPLSSLTQAQRTFLRNEILDAGYPLEELQAAHPNLSEITLGQVLRFMARRRLKPRYDKATDTIIMDGEIQPVRPIEEVDMV